MLMLAIVVSLMSVFATSASAATGKSKSYDVFKTKTITVTTEKSGSPYITFKSTGTGSYDYGAEAPILSLKVYNKKTGTTKWYRVTGSRVFESVSSKLSLNKNTTYIITISYIYSDINWGTYGIGMFKKTGYYQGYWQITKTNKLSYSFN